MPDRHALNVPVYIPPQNYSLRCFCSLIVWCFSFLLAGPPSQLIHIESRWGHLQITVWSMFFSFSPFIASYKEKGLVFLNSSGDALRKRLCTPSHNFHDRSSSIQVKHYCIPSLCRWLLQLVFITTSSLLLHWWRFFHRQPHHLHLQMRSMCMPWSDLLFQYACCLCHIDVVRFT